MKKKKAVQSVCLILAALLACASFGCEQKGEEEVTTVEEVSTEDEYYIAPPTDPGAVAVEYSRDFTDGRNTIQIPAFTMTGQSSAVDGLNLAITTDIGQTALEYEGTVGLDSTEDTIKIETDLFDDGRYVQAVTSVWRESSGEEGRAVYSYCYDRETDRALTQDDALSLAGIGANDPLIAVGNTIGELYAGGQLYESDYFYSFRIAPGGTGAIFYIYAGYTDSVPEYREGIFSYIRATGDRGTVDCAVEGYDRGLWESAAWQFPPQEGYTVGREGECDLPFPPFELLFPSSLSFIRRNDPAEGSVLLSDGIDGEGRALFALIDGEFDAVAQELAEGRLENYPQLAEALFSSPLPEPDPKAGKKADEEDENGLKCELLFDGAAGDDEQGNLLLTLAEDVADEDGEDSPAAASEAETGLGFDIGENGELVDLSGETESETAEDENAADAEAAEAPASGEASDLDPQSPASDRKLRMTLTYGEERRYVVLRGFTDAEGTAHIAAAVIWNAEGEDVDVGRRNS